MAVGELLGGPKEGPVGGLLGWPVGGHIGVPTSGLENLRIEPARWASPGLK